MLLGALAALVAWGIAFLILKRGTGTTQIAIAAGAGFLAAAALSWVVAIAILGPNAIPVAGIAGGVIGVVAAIVAAKRKPQTPAA